MLSENKFKLILRSRVFTIPSNFRNLRDVNENIYSTLVQKQRYIVKSNVRVNIFQYFINHWIDMKTPYITLDNISEYDQLSQEFDRMTDLVHLFKQKSLNYASSLLLHEKNILENQIKEKIDRINKGNEKKQKVLNILFNDNLIKSRSRLLEIKKELLNACLSLNIKFVFLLTRKEVKYNGLSFILNEDDKTASLIKNYDAKDDVYIPQSIEYESQEFIITVIIENAFKNSKNIKSIQFSEDSELRTIEKNSFFSSSLETISIPSKTTEIGECCFYLCTKLKRIEFSEKSELKAIRIHTFYKCPLDSITIPSSVIELDDGWCNGMINLNKFSIHSNNSIFKNFDNNYILKKSDEKSDIYDILLFARRNIDNPIIPPFIRIISPYAFKQCQFLKRIDFTENSQLEIIGSNSFSFTPIEKVFIPSNVIQIDDDAFSFCQNLNEVEFIENSKLQLIGKNAFSNTLIKTILIPSHVIQIMSYSFHNCKELQEVIFANDSELKSIDDYAFNMSYIQKVSIPKHVNQICRSAFADCYKLNTVFFDDNSELSLIDINAFYNTSIEEISIPIHVIKIGDSAFCNCKKLKIAEIKKNSELMCIGSKAFSSSLIESILISSFVSLIGENAFSNCWNLSIAEIDSHFDLHLDEKNVFQCTSIKAITKH